MQNFSVLSRKEIESCILNAGNYRILLSLQSNAESLLEVKHYCLCFNKVAQFSEGGSVTKVSLGNKINVVSILYEKYHQKCESDVIKKTKKKQIKTRNENDVAHPTPKNKIILIHH